MGTFDEGLTPTEVGLELKVDRKTVINWIVSKRLCGFRVNTSWRTTRLAVDQFIAKPPDMATPRKKREKSVIADCLEVIRRPKQKTTYRL